MSSLVEIAKAYTYTRGNTGRVYSDERHAKAAMNPRKSKYMGPLPNTAGSQSRAKLRPSERRNTAHDVNNKGPNGPAYRERFAAQTGTPQDIPKKWVKSPHTREATAAAKKAKILRGVKIGGGATAATAGAGAAALLAARSLRKPAQQAVQQVSGRTVAAVGGGGLLAGSGGGLVMRKRKKERS
jgi:hypothetical protein